MAQTFGLKCERTLHNRKLMVRSMEVLGLNDQWKWFGISTRAEMMKFGRKARLRKTILAELGRIDHDGDLRLVAAVIVKANPSSDRTAIKLIRKVRRDGAVPFNRVDLLNSILVTIKEYRKRFPACEWNDVRFVMYTALEDVQDACNRAMQAAQEAADFEREVLEEIRREEAVAA